MAAGRDDEWVVAPEQPTYAPGEPGVTVTPIPVMEKKRPKVHPRPKEPKDPKDKIPHAIRR